MRYRAAGSEAWSEVVDESRQRDHQRSLMGLTPGTEYEVEVTATVPNRRRRGRHAIRSPSGRCRRPPRRSTPRPVEPEPLPSGPPGSEEPIPHPPMTVNVLAEQAVWLPGTLTQVDPAFVSWLRRTCLGGATKLVLADLGQVPGRMRQAGFRGRDNALWYTLSRSYAEWNWHGDPARPRRPPERSAPGAARHLVQLHRRRRGRSCRPSRRRRRSSWTTTGPIGAGRSSGSTPQRQMNAVRGRVELGRFHHD